MSYSSREPINVLGCEVAKGQNLNIFSDRFF